MSQIVGITFNEFSKKMHHEAQQKLIKIEAFLNSNLVHSHDRSKAIDALVTAGMWIARAIKADQQIKDDREQNPVRYQVMEERKSKYVSALEKAMKEKSQSIREPKPVLPARREYRRTDGGALIVERKKKAE